jgi:dTDP-4-dehydrorhamnose 3,5-epimerase
MASLIEGVILTSQKCITNPKGDILHAMKSSGLGYVGFGEAYFTMVHHGMIKGWKKHKEATLNLVVPTGAVKFVLYDNKVSEPTKSKFNEFVLGEENYARLTVAPGLWVGFQGAGSGLNLVLNISDQEYDSNESDNLELEQISYVW